MTDVSHTAARKHRVTQHHRCRVCGGGDLVKYLDLPAMPLTDELLTRDDLGCEFLHPIGVWFCPHCALSQTQHDVDVGEYYRDYRYSVAASPFAARFMQLLACATWTLGDFAPNGSVVEVGSGDGVQLECFRRCGARVFGFEPSAPLNAAARRRGIVVTQCLFGKDSHERIPAAMLPVQVVLLTYTFDHLPDPLAFLASVAQVLDPQRGLLVIEVHDLAKIMERREYCLFEHEHATYCNGATLQRVLDRAGFDLVSTQLVPDGQRRGNSLLIAAALKGSRYPALPMLALAPFDDAVRYRAFGDEVQSSLARFTDTIAAKRRRGTTLAGYGAGGRGVMSLAATGPTGAFAYVCDRNQAFHGRFTPGAHVPVVAPDHLLRQPVDEVVVFSYGYYDEISRDLAAYTARGGRLISLLELL